MEADWRHTNFLCPQPPPPPPVHEWRIASSEGEHVCTPSTTDRHTRSAFMAPSPPGMILTSH